MVPIELQQLTCALECGARAQPWFVVAVKMESYKPDPNMMKRATPKMLLGSLSDTTVVHINQFSHGQVSIN